MKIKQAVILAGGQGTRLRPLTLTIPKPMVPVHGKPFVEYYLEQFRKEGIEEVVLLLGYLSQKFTEYLGDGSRYGLKFIYSIGTVEENNGTRVRNALPLLDERFLLVYGDMYYPLDLKEHLAFYEKTGRPVMMTVYDNKNNDGEYLGGNVEVKDGLVTYYDQFMDDLFLKGLDIGYSIIDRSLVAQVREEDFEFQGGFLRPLIAQGKVSGLVTQKPYCTITSVEFLKKAETYFRDQEKARTTSS